VNQPPEWPLKADGLRPMPSPYRSVVSSASPDFDPPPDDTDATSVLPVVTDDDPPATAPGPVTTPHDQRTRPPTARGRSAPPAGSQGQLAEPATGEIRAAGEVRASGAPAAAAVAPVPGTYLPPEGRAATPVPAPAAPVPTAPVPAPPPAGPLIPRQAAAQLPAAGLPRVTSGPPARAVSGPPARIAAAVAGLPFPGAAGDRSRTLVPATIVNSAAPAPPRRLKGVIAFVAILVTVLALGLTGYFWALPVYDQTHATVLAPDNLIGYRKVDAPSLYQDMSRTAGDELRKMDISHSLVVVYAASADPRDFVLFVGGTHAEWFGLGHELDRLLALVADEWDSAAGAVSAAPGRLGGVAKCREGHDRDDVVTVCGWQDHGTVGVLAFINRTTSEGAVLMQAMRPQLEHRGG